MTDRKPINVQWSSWIEGQITRAQAEGQFDNLPGAGKPIADLGETYNESWWVKRFMAREDVSWLPETLQVRRDVERLDEVLSRMSSETAVREYVTQLGERIHRVNTGFAAGPPTIVPDLVTDVVVDGWRAQLAERNQVARSPRPDDGEHRRRLVAAAIVAAQVGLAGGLVAALM